MYIILVCVHCIIYGFTPGIPASLVNQGQGGRPATGSRRRSLGKRNLPRHSFGEGKSSGHKADTKKRWFIFSINYFFNKKNSFYT